MLNLAYIESILINAMNVIKYVYINVTFKMDPVLPLISEFLATDELVKFACTSKRNLMMISGNVKTKQRLRKRKQTVLESKLEWCNLCCGRHSGSLPVFE